MSKKVAVVQRQQLRPAVTSGGRQEGAAAARSTEEARSSFNQVLPAERAAPARPWLFPNSGS
ncbi:hypothetical protein NDU88_006530 [Pleurodeles waltl]|uniref:Uncharacterized protein n=1 Tax=Pleurodeles waltl TaxID=8319 RepID=A0AAV7QM08_PLEWA|nr:hypothetical protein NDU88_006530 [Pleurodeles waltl]